MRFLLISILYLLFFLHSSVCVFKMCSFKTEQACFFAICIFHSAVRRTHYICPSLRWLRTLKRKEKFNFLNNPLAGTSGPDDTRHMLRVIKYANSDLLHLEATCIGPGLLENWLHAAAILLEELLGMLFRLNAFSLCLPWLCWLAFSSEYVSTVSSQFG